MLKFKCPQCGQDYEVEDELLGRKVACASCSTHFKVPKNGEIAKPIETLKIIDQDEEIAEQSQNQEAPKESKKKYCNKCGMELNENAKFCTRCGRELGTNTFEERDSKVDDKKFTDGWNGIFSRVSGVEKLEGFSLKTLFSAVFSKHSQEEIEDCFIVGTSKTTPLLSEVDSSWPCPWIFFRMLLMSISVYCLFWFSYKEFENNICLVPGLIITGAFAVPFSTMIFFMEVNILRNISMYQVLKALCFGGILSLIISLFFFHRVEGLTALIGDPIAGIVEESGKLLTVISLAAYNDKYAYKLNGLFFGAIVGTGFAIFETAGYALAAGLRDVGEMGTTLVLRGLLSPFGHIVWTAIASMALWRVKGKSKFSFSMLTDLKFLRLFAFPVLLHATWNLPLELPFLGKYIILGVISWIIVLMLVQEGLREVQECKTQDV